MKPENQLRKNTLIRENIAAFQECNIKYLESRYGERVDRSMNLADQYLTLVQEFDSITSELNPQVQKIIYESNLQAFNCFDRMYSANKIINESIENYQYKITDHFVRRIKRIVDHIVNCKTAQEIQSYLMFEFMNNDTRGFGRENREVKYKDYIIENWSSVFPHLTLIGSEVVMPNSKDRADIIAKTDNDQTVIIELKCGKSSGHKQLRSYSFEYDQDAITINISEKLPSVKHDDIQYTTYENIGVPHFDKITIDDERVSRFIYRTMVSCLSHNIDLHKMMCNILAKNTGVQVNV